VLHIEDNPVNSALVEQIFRSAPQARLLTTSSGQKGIELARRSRPDVILLDLHLPDIAGQTVLSELKHDPTLKEIPVIVVTADALAILDQRLVEVGAFACLSKPVNVVSLVGTVNSALEPPRHAS
jgi:CheY-like chemotaxis protein